MDSGSHSNARLKAVYDFCQRAPRIAQFPKDSADNQPQKLSQFFAQDVFTIRELRARLAKPVFNNLLSQMEGHQMIDRSTADAVAHAVKVWAMSRGAYHYSHWFQPLTNGTAEKHDSFLAYAPPTGTESASRWAAVAIESFSGSQLIQAEPDASSFPNGGSRTTFEARGYTVWDTTSPMFLHEGPHGTKTLMIPSIFISYNGDALDEKTILLRSCAAVSAASVKVLQMLGAETNCKHVNVNLGTEQEFFLIDRGLYSMRPDLKETGRTLIGAVPPKHQQLEDHYFAHVPSRVLAAISEAELQLWRLGVPIKTRHNEVAPQQFEMAPIFEEASVAVDHNLLTMDVLRTVAHRHGLKALFHEKPFAGVNGSGKHCNWSLSTDTGTNLLDPGDNPSENVTFKVFLSAILLGLERHGGLLAASIASSSNEHRLGANEAPPSIISAFLGEQISALLESIEHDLPVKQLVLQKKRVNLGNASLDVHIAHLPSINRDPTDRNRTSPFAFTGNRFEFRAVGSSQSPSFPVAMLNSITAAALEEIAIRLAKINNLCHIDNDAHTTAVDPSKISQADIKGVKAVSPSAIAKLLRELVTETKNVRFEGDGYSAEWHAEASKRKLFIATNAPLAFKQLMQPDNVKMLTGPLDIFSSVELHARYNIICTRYSHEILIDAKTLLEIAKQHIYPAVSSFRRILAQDVKVHQDIHNLNDSKFLNNYDLSLYERIITNATLLGDAIQELEISIRQSTEKLPHSHNSDLDKESCESSDFCCIKLKPLLEKVRHVIDSLETDLPDTFYPMPKYHELLLC